MITLSCEINKVPVTTILNFGADCNIISKEVVNGLGLKIDDSSNVEVYSPISKLDIVGEIREIELSIPSQDPKQVKVTDIFVVNSPEHVLKLELLEQILYFLEIDRSLHPVLFVNYFWYHCGVPILWRRIEFSIEGYQWERRDKNTSGPLYRQLRKLKKVMCVKIKPLYCSKMVYLKLAGLKISDALLRTILYSCPNIKFLILDRSYGFSNILIIEIAKYCLKLQHLSLNACGSLTDRCITEIARSCQKLRHLELGDCSIGNKAVEEIARNCTNLKYLSLERCKGISEEVMKKLNPKISVSKPLVKIEHPDYSDDEWSDLPPLIPDETDFISAFGDYIRVSSGLTRPERINISNSLVQAIDQRLHRS
ncbi:hypothetical protein Glove_426g33 [Diversispora epigaea]|uniref:F-box domain-containing protein n=1 Tax=Diversispora epigaea TaxID=1348612 RepID=A0A397GY59_9GLOM|nr:hypothetical protein Glove_426g33 [Diversispora epigaea]